MTYLLRLSAFLLLCVSLNSFGALFAMNYYGIQAMDFDTGNWSQVSAHPSTGQGDAGALAAVPLPAGITLFLSGLVGLGFVKTR